jgi:hypothetical protein
MIAFDTPIGQRAQGPCIEWDGARMATGYGVITLRGADGVRSYVVHRLVWQIFHGPIPEGLFVCHHCDNPPCIRVDHLFLGTHADNMADMVAKGRQCRGERWHVANPVSGRATVTAKQVLETRAE